MTTVIDKGHSKYGGSSADCYMNCAASVALSATIPALADPDYSLEGTAAHFVAEECLKKFLPAENFLDYLYTKPGHAQVEVTGNMVDAVNVYLKAVETERTLTVDAELYVEQEFQLDVPGAEGEVWGRNDAMVWHPSTGRLRVFDYKHGVGVSVSADDNNQLKFYAAGAVFTHPDWKVKEIIVTIVQPRARDADNAGEVKDWPFDTVDLLDFIGDVEEAIRLSKNVGENFSEAKVGPWCRWCDAAGICPAKAAAAMEAATLDVSVTDVTVDDLPEPRSLDVERLSRIVAGLDIVQEWQRRCQELLEGLLLSGVAVPGWKVVDKLGRAKWTNNPTEIASYAEMMFGIDTEQMMPRKLTTITEAEKLLKAAGATKAQIDDFKIAHTIKESAGHTIAPASDRRPAINAAADNFGTVKI